MNKNTNNYKITSLTKITFFLQLMKQQWHITVAPTLLYPFTMLYIYGIIESRGLDNGTIQWHIHHYNTYKI